MTRLAILVGGRSTEHDASIHSYASVLDALARRGGSAGYQLTRVDYVDREGVPFAHRQPPWPRDGRSLAAGSRMTFGTLIDELAASDAFVFNLLHGNEGEDGAWQGIAEVAGIRGSFGQVFAASVTMNKWAQSLIAVASDAGVRMPPTWRIRDADPSALREIIAQLGGAACVVKPNRMGASHFAERYEAPTIESLRTGIEAILPFDDEVLIQRYIEGEEYTCGCIERDGVEALPVIRAVTARAFLGHAEKHRRGLVRPDLVLDDDAITSRVKQMSCDLFVLFNLSGMCRFDFIVDGQGVIWFLEANSIPGLMGGSAFPKMLAAAGLDLVDLIDCCYRASERAPARRKLLEYTIED